MMFNSDYGLLRFCSKIALRLATRHTPTEKWLIATRAKVLLRRQRRDVGIALLQPCRKSRTKVSGRFPTVSSLTVPRGWTAQRGVVIDLNGKRKKKGKLNRLGTVAPPSVEAAASDGLVLRRRFDKHPILARTFANLCRRTAPARSASETQANIMCASSQLRDSTHHPQHPCFHWPALAISLDNANRHPKEVDTTVSLDPCLNL